MEYEEILKVLAPCGLNCKKCFANARGDIKKYSEKLKQRLGAFDKFAERFVNFDPVFKNYPNFEEILSYFTRGDCSGCREGSCLYADCGVFACYKETNIDFCFQCPEFPCERTNFDSDLKKRWLSMNNRMKEIGIEKYYQEIKDLPRYK